MFGNIILVAARHGHRRQTAHYWEVLMGMLGITFLTEGGYPAHCR